MKVIQGSNNIPRPLRAAVLTIGNFDGVHIGHQEIFRRLKASAAKLRGTSVVYTFDPHPVRTIAPDASPKMIQTFEQKMGSIEKCGIDVCIVEKFTRAFSRIHPDEFFKKVILGRIRPLKIIVGHDLTFGRRRLGTVETLSDMCMGHGIALEVVEAVFLRGTLVSSTQIRSAVAMGDMKKAGKMLGRPYQLTGLVTRGRGIGRELGYHTANIIPDNEIVPPSGVYVTRALGHSSVTNIGRNPTFGGSGSTVETHIIDFSKNIYGKRIIVDFFMRLRDEKAFENPLSLKRQIARDIKKARRLLEHGKI